MSDDILLGFLSYIELYPSMIDNVPSKALNELTSKGFIDDNGITGNCFDFNNN